jgi:hypothetical protein
MSQQPKDPRNLSVCTRRNLWRALLQETVVTSRTLAGGQAFRLAELGDWPDARLATLRPKVSRDFDIFMDGDEICARHRDTGKVERLFTMDKAPLAVFNQFNGENDLATVSLSLAREMGWDEPQAFAYTRALFLDLVARLVCLPANVPPVSA